MTTIDLSQERINEILQRQNGLCAISGKKFENINEEKFQIFSIKQNIDQNDLDNFVLIWNNADLSIIKRNDEFISPLRKYYFQYANFQNYTNEEKAGEILEELIAIKNSNPDNSNFKNSIATLKNLSKTLQSLNLDEENFTKLNNEINEYLHELEKNYSVIRNQINAESTKFYNNFKAKIEDLLKTPSKWQNLRSARQKLMNLQKEINNTKEHISRSTIEDLKRIIADALNSISQKQIAEKENYEMECSDNYLQLKNIFEKLIASIDNTTEHSKVRQSLIEAQKLIASKTLKRSHQEELYQMIRNGFEILTQNQENEKSTFLQEANENYEKLSPLVENAIKIAASTDTFKEARETLIAAQTSIKGMALTKEQRDELYGKIRTIFQQINQLQEEERTEFIKVSEENFQKLLDKIGAEKEKLLDNPHFKTIRENLLTIQSEIRVWKLKTDHRNKLYNTLKDVFALLDEKRNIFFESQKKDKKSKTESIFKNLNEKLVKLEEAVEMDKKELSELQIKLNEANDYSIKDDIRKEFDRIQVKISEKEKRINETKQRISESE
jgi:uncharacterized protein (DUF362 family)